MTTQIKGRRFRLKRGTGPTGQDATPATTPEDTAESRTPAEQPPAAREDAPPQHPPREDPAAVAEAAAPADPPQHGADVTGDPQTDAELAAIRAEQLTARQLRMAMRVATRHGIRATSGLDAVRLLRRRGIDPFERSTLLDLVRAETPPQTQQGRNLAVVADKLPQAKRGPELPQHAADSRMKQLAAEREKELGKIKRDITRRRRRRLLQLGARLLLFVSLPTTLLGYYFYVIATPLYATEAEFIIQQADSAMPAAAGGLGGMMGGGLGLGNSQDSITVQSYLQSRGAMRRLDAEEGFRAHFSTEEIDPLRRLAPDASEEAMYRLYQRQVRISFDPTEGIVRLEVSAATPEDSERFASALIAYAEEQVDLMTARMRENQMQDARDSYLEAEERMQEARRRAVELQESFAVLSGEVEVSLLSQQIVTLETELTQNRLSLQELLSNPRPNQARVGQLQRRISNLESQIGALRGSMTQGSDDGGSLARIQSELVMAEADIQTRQMLLSQALQQLESARIEANRQVRYLSLSVTPIAPDEATYPRALENTALAFLVFSGIYLFLSMTVAILREQVSA